MAKSGLLLSLPLLVVACGGETKQANIPDPEVAPIVAPSARPEQAAPRSDGGVDETVDPSISSILNPTPNTETASVKGISEKIKFVSGDTPFGGGKSNPASYAGLIFRTQPSPTALPDFAKMKPIGGLFANTLAVAPGTAFTGFPGIDKARATEFAIRYEAPLNVGTEAIYEIRLVSDDGAKLFIDEMKIIDNDGVAAGAPKEGKASVHLVKAKHSIRVDYFQGAGTVALQLFVTPPGATEAPLGTNLH